MPFIFFFFSSRRRHTRCSRDWSSDVCSSDLSKAALEALTRYLAVELGRQGITVNAVSAGAVETDVWHMIPDGAQALEAIRARTPGGRLVTPEAGADVGVFLASAGAQGVQGQGLTVDGGYSLLA